jgi:hypothetical protein
LRVGEGRQGEGRDEEEEMRGVYFGVHGNVVVEDDIYVGNIQPAAGHIRRHQDGARLPLELRQGPKTLRLWVRKRWKRGWTKIAGQCLRES